jgi:adenylate cyclase
LAYLVQTRKLFLRGALLSAALSAAFFILTANTAPMQWLENGSYDTRVRWTAKDDQPDNANVVIVDVDNDSFDKLKGKLGRWPWERKVWTATLDWVSQGKPKAVLFDVTFEGASQDASIDERFASAIHDNGHVVLAASFVGVQSADESSAENWSMLQREAVTPIAGEKNYAKKEWQPNVPVRGLANAAAGIGIITADFDSDGVIRRVPLFFNSDGRAWPSLSTRGVEEAEGAKYQGHMVTPYWFDRGAGGRLALDGRGRLLVRWHLRHEPDRHRTTTTFRRVPLLQAICSAFPQSCPEYRERITPDVFAGKVVIIGASAAGAFEPRPMPFAATAPGFLAHAAAVDNLIAGESIRVTPPWASWLLILFFAALGTAIALLMNATLREITTVGMGVALYGWVSFIALKSWGLWLPVIAPVGALGLAYAASNAVRYATTGRELRRTRSTLNRYMAPELVEYVLNHPDQLNLAGERKDLTIFFSDVRNFTTLTEGSEAQALVKQLNEYLYAMTETIMKYQGIVDKFIGDGILAHWGAFTPGQNHAVLAAQASLEMIERLRELNVQWKAEGRPELAIGIGLNSGEVIFGEMGAGKKVEFTVIGDPVNLAARLEGLNKEFKTTIIISEFTLAVLGDAAIARPLGGVKVKGKTIETTIFELQGLKATAADSAKLTAVAVK